MRGKPLVYLRFITYSLLYGLLKSLDQKLWDPVLPLSLTHHLGIWGWKTNHGISNIIQCTCPIGCAALLSRYSNLINKKPLEKIMNHYKMQILCNDIALYFYYHSFMYWIYHTARASGNLMLILIVGHKKIILMPKYPLIVMTQCLRHVEFEGWVFNEIKKAPYWLVKIWYLANVQLHSLRSLLRNCPNICIFTMYLFRKYFFSWEKSGFQNSHWDYASSVTIRNNKRWKSSKKYI